jgi:hypothetical protein
LLPGFQVKVPRRASEVLRSDNDVGDDDDRPVRRSGRSKGRGSVRAADDDESDGDRPVKRSRRSKGKDPVRAADVARPPAAGLSAAGPSAAGPSAAGPSAASRRICLRCSKRIHLESTYPTPEGVVAAGYHCDSVAFRKCSYCAAGHHACDEVGLSFACLGSANASGRSRKGFWILWAI